MFRSIESTPQSEPATVVYTKPNPVQQQSASDPLVVTFNGGPAIPITRVSQPVQGHGANASTPLIVIDDDSEETPSQGHKKKSNESNEEKSVSSSKKRKADQVLEEPNAKRPKAMNKNRRSRPVPAKPLSEEAIQRKWLSTGFFMDGLERIKRLSQKTVTLYPSKYKGDVIHFVLRNILSVLFPCDSVFADNTSDSQMYDIMSVFVEYLDTIVKMELDSIDHPILRRYPIDADKLGKAVECLRLSLTTNIKYRTSVKKFCVVLGGRDTDYVNCIVAVAAYLGVDTVVYIQYDSEKNVCSVDFTSTAAQPDEVVTTTSTTAKTSEDN
jgi:hypothetical protein